MKICQQEVDETEAIARRDENIRFSGERFQCPKFVGRALQKPQACGPHSDDLVPARFDRVQGGGGLSAAASMTFLMGSPALVFVYLAPLPLLLVGLGLGAKAGAIAGVTGLMVAGLTGGATTAGLYGLLNALPAALVVRQALMQKPTGPAGGAQWYPVGSILGWLTVLGAGIFLTATLASHVVGGTGIEGSVSTYLDRAFTIMAPTLGESERAMVVARFTPLFPGFVVTSWLLMTAVNGALAQALLVRMGHGLRPKTALADLNLPEWMSAVLVAAAAVALFGPGEMEYIGRNLVIILAVPFFFLGLAVIHTVARRAVPLPMLLAVFYFVFYGLLLITAWAAMIVAGIGLIEQWGGGLRRRFAGPGKNRENV